MILYMSGRANSRFKISVKTFVWMIENFPGKGGGGKRIPPPPFSSFPSPCFDCKRPYFPTSKVVPLPPPPPPQKTRLPQIARTWMLLRGVGGARQAVLFGSNLGRRRRGERQGNKNRLAFKDLRGEDNVVESRKLRSDSFWCTFFFCPPPKVTKYTSRTRTTRTTTTATAIRRRAKSPPRKTFHKTAQELMATGFFVCVCVRLVAWKHGSSGWCQRGRGSSGVYSWRQ